MFKTSLVGNTGGHVSYKKVQTENGERDRLSFTVFVRERGQEKKTPVFCVWTGKNLSEIAKYLMIENTKEDAKSPYCSRLVAIDGRLSLQTKVKEIAMYDKVKTGEVDEDGEDIYTYEKALDEKDKPITFYSKVTTTCVFIDNLELLDKSPGKVSESGHRVDKSRLEIINKYRVNKDDVKADPMEDIEPEEVEPEDTEPVKEVEKTVKEKEEEPKKRSAKRKRKKSNDKVDEDLSDEDILGELAQA